MAFRPVAAGLAMVGLALAACDNPSRVGRDEAVAITGAVLSPDGLPLIEHPVRLGTGRSDGDMGLALLTVGLSCVDGSCTDDVRDSSTDEKGAFRFDLVGDDTQSRFGEALLHVLTATGAPTGDQVSGASVSARFFVQTADLQLPPLQLIDPKLRVDGRGGAVVSTWEATAAPGPYRLTFEAASPVPVWTVETMEGEVAVDPRVLEDTAGRVVVGGEVAEAVVGSDLGVGWRSPGAGYAAGAGAPPSRGATCTANSGGGTCPFTDGDLDRDQPVTPPCDDAGDAQCGAPPGVDVTLRDPVAAELVVVRGCLTSCPVDVSDDGTAFRPVGVAASPYATVPLDGTLIRAVRVRVPSHETLREVSVWDAPRPSSPLRDLDDPQSLRGRFGFGTGDDTRRTMAITVAALLVALTGAAAGFLAGRRRVGAGAPRP